MWRLWLGVGARGNLGREKEERSMWRKNALFVGAQIAAIVGVLGLATLTMVSDGDMAEEDMEDDEEEEWAGEVAKVGMDGKKDEESAKWSVLCLESRWGFSAYDILVGEGLWVADREILAGRFDNEDLEKTDVWKLVNFRPAPITILVTIAMKPPFLQGIWEIVLQFYFILHFIYHWIAHMLVICGRP